MANNGQLLDLSILKEPRCLIDTNTGTGQMYVVSAVAEELAQLDKPCVVVAIAGQYRTGKSYLMNRLAGRKKGFGLGSTVQSCTKGIWIWVRIHPRNPDIYLVLLDTEGLGDPEKGDANHDNWVLCLATLLSSTLVFNMFGVIDESAIAKLNFITELSKRIRTHDKDSTPNDQNFDWYFPMFVIALRDFCVQKIINGREVTSDEYLEHCLALKHGDSEAIKSYNQPRICIRRYFPQRKCFTFDRPVMSWKLFSQIESMNESQLSEDFVEEASGFCQFIFHHAPVKQIENGVQINGRMLSTLAASYVDAISAGAVPCIENALIAMATKENTRTVEQGVALYRNLMIENITMPADDDQILVNVHKMSLKEAVKYFLDRAIYDSNQAYQEELNERIEAELLSFKRQDEEASLSKCHELLRQLNEVVETKLKSGQYARPGGSMEYQQDVDQIQTQYQATPGLGVKMASTLVQFLEEKSSERQGIMKTDERVTAEEKKAEEAKMEALLMQEKKLQAEREAEMERQHAEETQQAMEENLAQLKAQQEKDMAQIQQHHEQVLNSRLAEQQRSLKEGFDRQAAELQKQIEDLKNRPPPPPPPQRRRKRKWYKF